MGHRGATGRWGTAASQVAVVGGQGRLSGWKPHPTPQRPQAYSVAPWSRAEALPALPEVGRKEARHTPAHSCRLVHTPPSLPRCQHTSPSLPLALLAAPAPPAPHFAADPVWQCPRNRRITAGATGPLCQATENAAKISRGQTGGRPTGTLPSWPQPGLSPKALPSSSWTAGEGVLRCSNGEGGP